jgi:protein involved in polysaccharide export with SLBB domain
MNLPFRTVHLICSVGCLVFAVASYGAPASEAPPMERTEKPTQVVDGSYRLALHDVVKVTVYQQDDLTTTARIGEDGSIQFPLIGGVDIGGKTVRQASALIETLLKKDYLVHPQVAISIVEFVKKRFTVLGQVKSPGSYEVSASENVDVIQAIGMAGGYTRSANQGKIMIKRVADGSERVYRINGKEIAHGDGAKSFRIQAGDTITVEESLF